MRNTNQRKAIQDVIRSKDGPLTVDEILKRGREDCPFAERGHGLPQSEAPRGPGLAAADRPPGTGDALRAGGEGAPPSLSLPRLRSCL